MEHVQFSLEEKKTFRIIFTYLCNAKNTRNVESIVYLFKNKKENYNFSKFTRTLALTIQ